MKTKIMVSKIEEMDFRVVEEEEVIFEEEEEVLEEILGTEIILIVEAGVEEEDGEILEEALEIEKEDLIPGEEIASIAIVIRVILKPLLINTNIIKTLNSSLNNHLLIQFNIILISNMLILKMHFAKSLKVLFMFLIISNQFSKFLLFMVQE
jgi:hypothetical protein